jgi:hypothetical protein
MNRVAAHRFHGNGTLVITPRVSDFGFRSHVAGEDLPWSGKFAANS